ncbi:MAG: AbrB family transcriptional regulator, partial [Proteobacteria bacterium]|nr:AbrB family transcriptional regulator [Pseudomonadota bacterium]
MILNRSRLRRSRDFAESVAVAATGGALFDAAGFPAGWLAGAMLFAALAALAGRPVMIPTWLARAFFIAIGISLGTVATPQTVHGMATWPLSIALVCLAMACVTAATVAFLVRVHRWDVATAILASMPGALSQVMVLAAERRLDLRAIAVVQTTRVVVLAIGVPAVLALAGLAGPSRPPSGTIAIADAPVEFLVLVMASVAAGLATFRLGFSGGLVFAPMLVSALLHGGDFVHVALPGWLVNAAMVALGLVAGARFTNTPPAEMVRHFRAALGAFVIAILVTAAFAGVAVALLPIGLGDVFVA